MANSLSGKTSNSCIDGVHTYCSLCKPFWLQPFWVKARAVLSLLCSCNPCCVHLNMYVRWQIGLGILRLLTSALPLGAWDCVAGRECGFKSDFAGEKRAELVGDRSQSVAQGTSWTLSQSARQECGRRRRGRSHHRNRPKSKKNGTKAARARSCRFVQARECLPKAAQGSGRCVLPGGRNRRQSQAAEAAGAASVSGGSVRNVQRSQHLPQAVGEATLLSLLAAALSQEQQSNLPPGVRNEDLGALLDFPGPQVPVTLLESQSRVPRESLNSQSALMELGLVGPEQMATGPPLQQM